MGGGRSPRGSTWRITVPSNQIRRILALEINDEASSGCSNRAGEHDWKAAGGPRRADNDLGSRYGVSTFKRDATAVAERAGSTSRVSQTSQFYNFLRARVQLLNENGQNTPVPSPPARPSHPVHHHLPWRNTSAVSSSSRLTSSWMAVGTRI